jgi:hypothetical protein
MHVEPRLHPLPGERPQQVPDGGRQPAHRTLRSRRETACWDPATTYQKSSGPAKVGRRSSQPRRGAPADGVVAASTRVLAHVTLRAAGVVDHSRLPCSRPSWRLQGVQGNRYDRDVGSTA